MYNTECNQIGFKMFLFDAWAFFFFIVLFPLCLHKGSLACSYDNVQKSTLVFHSLHEIFVSQSTEDSS